MGAEQKVVIVTGASRGIGAGMVRGFLNRNYRVVATSRSIKPSSERDLLTIAGDIGQSETADRIIEGALSHFGRIDTLVNNAGIFISKPFTDVSLQDWNTAIATNMAGFFYITQRAVDVMLRKNCGHIINITAALADAPTVKSPSLLAAITKGGLNAATKSLAIELAPQRIRVNAIAPGVINTPLHPQEKHPILAKMHPLGRLGEVPEIVEAALYLDAGPYLTGQILHVDGGRSVGRW
jgi:NAD(P)-dependent dehydrogenase (short-subunit alcohol dehydrogenase family)